jgi:hypothetical protein
MADLLGFDMHRDATFSRGDQNRLTLTRRWDANLPHVCFIGLNPSTADHRIDDPTVRRWVQFAKSWGYGGFVAVNLYPFRSSSPAICRRWADWENNGPDWYARDDIMANLDIVAREAKAAALVVACWGAGAWDEPMVEHVIELVMSGSEPWPDIHCFGLTNAGAPMHPMARGKHRIPDSAQPTLWKLSYTKDL